MPANRRAEASACWHARLGDVVVRTERCRVVVTYRIEISGEGASRAVARNIRRAIAGCSPATTGGYSLAGCCKVVMRAKVQVRRRNRGPRPGRNQITITNDSSFRSEVVGGESGTWYSGESAEVFAHEAAHLLGLGDEYVDRTDAEGNTYSQALPGHEMDKMGGPGGKFGMGVAARGALDSLLARKGATCDINRCCRMTTTTQTCTTITVPEARWCCIDHCAPPQIGCILRGECTAPLGEPCCVGNDSALFIQVGSCADFVSTCTQGCQ
jgi:hypothetical protein